MTKLVVCLCERWGKNIKELDRVTMSGFIHGVYYEGEKFDYCPWCGNLLEKDDDGEPEGVTA